MALSKDLIHIYATTAQAGVFTELSFLALPENRRKDMETRIQTLLRKTEKGRRLENTSLQAHEASSQKSLKELLQALMTSNAFTWRALSCTGKASSRISQLCSLLLEDLSDIYGSCSFVLHYDPAQIQGSFLKSALRKASQGVQTAEGHLAENSLLQASWLLAQLGAIQAGLPVPAEKKAPKKKKAKGSGKSRSSQSIPEQTPAAETQNPAEETQNTQLAAAWPLLMEQLMQMEKYPASWKPGSGELALLEDGLPSAQKALMEQMAALRPDVQSQRIWTSLARTRLKDTETALLEQLFAALPADEFAGLSLSRLQRDPGSFEQKLARLQDPCPQPALDEKKLKTQKVRYLQRLLSQISPQDFAGKEPCSEQEALQNLDERAEFWIAQILPDVLQEQKYPKERLDVYLSLLQSHEGLELLLVPVRNRLLLEQSLEAAGLTNRGDSLAARLRIQEETAARIREQCTPVLLRLSGADDFSCLEDWLARQPEPKKVLHVSRLSAPLMKAWMLKHNVFLDLQAESVADSPLLEAARTLHEQRQDPLPEMMQEREEDTASVQKTAPERVPYFSGGFDPSCLDEAQIQFLSQGQLSEALTRRLALAFSRGLELSAIQNRKKTSSPQDFQKELRLMLLPWLFSARFVRLFQSAAEHLSVPELDFVSLPGISYEKARRLIEVLENGAPLAVLQQTVSRQDTLNQIVRKTEPLLQKEWTEPEEKNIQENLAEKTQTAQTLRCRVLPEAVSGQELHWRIERALQGILPQDRQSEMNRIINQAYCQLVLQLGNDPELFRGFV